MALVQRLFRENKVTETKRGWLSICERRGGLNERPPLDAEATVT